MAAEKKFSFVEDVLKPTVVGLGTKLPLEMAFYPITERYKRHSQNLEGLSKLDIVKRIYGAPYQGGGGVMDMALWRTGEIWKGAGGVAFRELSKFHRYPIVAKGPDYMSNQFPGMNINLINLIISGTSAAGDIGVGVGERASALRAKPGMTSYREALQPPAGVSQFSHLMVGGWANLGKQWSSVFIHLEANKAINEALKENCSEYMSPAAILFTSSMATGFARALGSNIFDIPKSIQQMSAKQQISMKDALVANYQVRGVRGLLLTGMGSRTFGLFLASLALNLASVESAKELSPFIEKQPDAAPKLVDAAGNTANGNYDKGLEVPLFSPFEGADPYAEMQWAKKVSMEVVNKQDGSVKSRA